MRVCFDSLCFTSTPLSEEVDEDDLDNLKASGFASAGKNVVITSEGNTFVTFFYLFLKLPFLVSLDCARFLPRQALDWCLAGELVDMRLIRLISMK